MEKKRIVVTGLGVLSPVGCTTDKFWKALIEGKSGIGPITHFDATDFDSRIAGTVKDYDPLDHFSTKEARNFASFVQFAAVAADQAIAHSKLDLNNVDLDRVGVLIGSGIGSINTIENEYERYKERGAKKLALILFQRSLLMKRPVKFLFEQAHVVRQHVSLRRAQPLQMP